VAEKTALSSQYFNQLQKFVVLELGLVLMPVSQCSEAAGFLLELVRYSNYLDLFLPCDALYSAKRSIAIVYCPSVRDV